MSIRGNLKEASLPDVIQLLSLGKKTGILSVSDKKNFGEIFFRNGVIIYCSIVNRDERIGTLLLKAGDISKADLNKALEIQEEMKGMKRIGDILMEMNIITVDILRERVKKQIIDSIFILLTWKEGFFNFEPDIAPISETITVELEADDILLEEARKVDEWSIIEKYLPSEKTILKKTGINNENIQKQSDEEYVLSLVNSQNTLKDLFDKSALGKFETGKALFSLMRIGYISAGEEKAVNPSASIQMKVQEHHNLGIAFLLTEMYEEALREFKHIIQIDRTNTKAFFYLGMINFRLARYDEAQASFEEILKLGVTNVALMNNLALVYERRGVYDKAEEYYERAVKIEPESAKLLANYGIVSYKQNLLTDAEERLKLALKIEPNLKYAKYFLALVKAESGSMNEALNMFFELSKSDTANWQIYYNIAQIYIIMGKTDSAEQMLKRATEHAGNEILPFKILSDFYFTEKNFDAAEEILMDIINLQKDDFDALYKLGNIKYRKGNRESAIGYWEKALALQPENEILKKTLETVKHG